MVGGPPATPGSPALMLLLLSRGAVRGGAPWCVLRPPWLSLPRPHTPPCTACAAAGWRSGGFQAFDPGPVFLGEVPVVGEAPFQPGDRRGVAPDCFCGGPQGQVERGAPGAKVVDGDGRLGVAQQVVDL